MRGDERRRRRWYRCRRRQTQSCTVHTTECLYAEDNIRFKAPSLPIYRRYVCSYGYVCDVCVCRLKTHKTKKMTWTFVSLCVPAHIALHELLNYRQVSIFRDNFPWTTRRRRRKYILKKKKKKTAYAWTKYSYMLVHKRTHYTFPLRWRCRRRKKLKEEENPFFLLLLLLQFNVRKTSTNVTKRACTINQWVCRVLSTAVPHLRPNAND